MPPGSPTLPQIADKLMHNNWYIPVEPLAEDEIRISFMGTAFVPRIAQAANSVFIEVGTGQSFVFDLGMGTLTKYRPWACRTRACSTSSSRTCTPTT